MVSVNALKSYRIGKSAAFYLLVDGYYFRKTILWFYLEI
jgi:hypothetical protein